MTDIHTLTISLSVAFPTFDFTATLKPEMFKEGYEAITTGNQRWNELKVKEGKNYEWDPNSTYIHNPPFFAEMEH